MSCLGLVTFWFCLAEGLKVHKRHVYNSITPLEDTDPVYNISAWVRQLHLQQCVIVEVGETYCAVFVEYRPTEFETGETEEYFLGLCDITSIRDWKLCPAGVERKRSRECTFQEHPEKSKHPSRVHRRLCDVTSLGSWGQRCNCSNPFRDLTLYEVIGFPTCFPANLPQTLCDPGNVCGVQNCTASTVNKVHAVKCNPLCLGRQPFCEMPGMDTARPSEITSYWSDWNEPECEDDEEKCRGLTFLSSAVCIDKDTGMGAIDCLGPGTSCCPADSEACKCHTYIDNGILMLSREFKIKPSLELKRNVWRARRHNFKTRRRSAILDSFMKKRRSRRKKQTEEEEFGDDDESEDDDEQDVVLEEEESTVSTTEELEKDERVKEMQKVHYTGKVLLKELNGDEVDVMHTKSTVKAKNTTKTANGTKSANITKTKSNAYRNFVNFIVLCCGLYFKFEL